MKVLLLNTDYSPFRIINWQKAITSIVLHEDIFECGADIIEVYEGKIIRSGRKDYPYPAVIRKLEYSKPRAVALSKKNIFIRDQLRCAYCWQRFGLSSLTLDHIIPKSLCRQLGYKYNTWENLTACCSKCNKKKGSKSLDSLGWKLLEAPRCPAKGSIIGNLCPWDNIQPEWRQYIEHLKYYSDFIKEKEIVCNT